ncbi:heme peroxidase [Mycena metata]|uniref:Heme peroxidase n=1 Tax=Mycena metata TaxID=1033252 RepID=A0AAD7ILM5_9AGAR|nr:heme peroxidase [Mycena metata]
MPSYPEKGGNLHDSFAKSRVSRWIRSVKQIKSKWALTPEARIVKEFLDSVIQPRLSDDRIGAFMDGIALLSTLPPKSPTAVHMADITITTLCETVPHPPAASLGYKHAFRRADGGGNNLLNPEIGRAGTPYARCVSGTRTIPTTVWPDPGLVFDTLMRKRARRDHPAGFSSLMFAFGALVAHSLFRTDPLDWSINSTSSYLDLSPLYGVDQDAQDRIRDKQGLGMLFPDVFSEPLIFLPPAASALLVLFNRNHNYITDMLLKINERGRWSEPPPAEPRLKAQQDEEIFQIARLINCGHFKSALIGDFFGGLLGLSEGITSSLPDHAVEKIKRQDGTTVQRGQGHQCSVEFSLAYRWVSTISAREEEWMDETFAGLLGETPLERLSLGEFAAAVDRAVGCVNPDPRMRSFGGIRRQSNGRFTDYDLATTLQDASESPASAFHARGTPRVMRSAEILRIIQARHWGVCTLNEFREFLGLQPFKTFEEWNEDVPIASAARRLYGHIDNLELYVRWLQCEAPMPLRPGLRFACGETLMRALLVETVSVIRGDRFLATDFTPANLTAWGYRDCQRDSHNGGFAGQLPKLLMRHLPRHYPFNSVYSCFPFFTPSKMEHSLTVQRLSVRYTFRRPAITPRAKIINTIAGISYVLSDPAGRFPPIYEMNGLGAGYGFLYGFDGTCRDDPDQAWIMHALFPSLDALDQCRAWYRARLIQNIKERSWKYGGVSGEYIDVVKSVINATAMQWAAEYLCGFHLKKGGHSRGVYTEQEFYDMLTTLSTYHILCL